MHPHSLTRAFVWHSVDSKVSIWCFLRRSAKTDQAARTHRFIKVFAANTYRSFSITYLLLMVQICLKWKPKYTVKKTGYTRWIFRHCLLKTAFGTCCLFSCTPNPFLKGVCSKRKEFVPTGSRLIFRRETKTIWQGCLPWKCIHSP